MPQAQRGTDTPAVLPGDLSVAFSAEAGLAVVRFLDTIAR
jgi:hypothetical protein